MSLAVAGAVRLGDGGTSGFRLEVDCVARRGEVTVVVGPNGAGKTTMLRTLAGTLPLESGSVELGGSTLDAPPEVFVPPECRNLGVVHQEHLLFAHLSALDNVAFGLRCRGVTRSEARRQAQGWLERFGVGSQAGLRPAALSGGQAQRVTLARALAPEPAALLLDEPFAALDATTRKTLRRELRRHLVGFTGPIVLVTHDPLDVLTLADHLVVLEDGRVVQSGALSELVARPQSRFLADLLGVNLVAGVRDGGVLRTPDGLSLPLVEPGLGVAGHALTVAFPPAAVRVERGGDVRDLPDKGGAPTPVSAATVDDIEVVGGWARIHLAGPSRIVAELSLGELVALGVGEGSDVEVTVDPHQISVVDR